MSMFSGMGSAKRQFDSNYLKAGRYIARIDECREFQATKGDSFKAVMTILHVIDNNSGLAQRVGEQVTWMVMKQPYPQSFLARVKQLIVTVLECPDEAVGEGEMVAITGDVQALAGYCVEVEAREVPKKDQALAKPGQVLMTTRVTFKRNVLTSEVKQLMTPEQIAKIYPAGIPAEA